MVQISKKPFWGSLYCERNTFSRAAGALANRIFFSETVPMRYRTPLGRFAKCVLFRRHGSRQGERTLRIYIYRYWGYSNLRSTLIMGWSSGRAPLLLEASVGVANISFHAKSTDNWQSFTTCDTFDRICDTSWEYWFFFIFSETILLASLCKKINS